jgi:UDP-glucose 4-epimerase
MTRHLLIGGNGVVGHFVTRRLVEEGHRPVVMSRKGDMTLIADIRDRCDIVCADITDEGSIDGIVRQYGISHIAHLAAALPNIAETHPALAIRANAEGTANVLEAARRNRVARVVFASSKSVYGTVTGEHGFPTYKPILEDKAPDPVTIYGISKLSAEHVGRWYNRNYGVEFVALRFGSTIGPGKISRHGGSFSRFSRILENAMAGKPVEIANGGDAVCDALFNADVARGIVCALHAPPLKHDVFNIATGTGFTLADYAASVKRLYPDADISIGGGSGDPKSMNCVLDVARAREDLGFSVVSDIDDIVERYVAAMRQLGLAPETGIGKRRI